MTEDIEYEVYCDDMMEAASNSEEEAMRYAWQYAEDGAKTEVYEVVSKRRLIMVINDTV